MRRIFAAINISEEARRMAARYADDLRSGEPRAAASWVRPEKLHLTLRFIGSCTDRALESFTTSVRNVSAQTRPFDLAIAGTGVFPSAKQPRVMWLGVRDPTNSLRAIERGIRPAGAETAVALAMRGSFSPHLTIARVKDTHECRALAARHLSSAFESPSFRVTEIVIYDSTLHPAGSVHKVLWTHPFTAG